MKKTFSIDPSVMAELKREATRRGCSMSEVVETALRLLFKSWKSRVKLPPLPSFDGGEALVDVADQDALDQAAPRWKLR
jgi:Ribbon-helix-helix protein, copG family